MPIVRDFRTRVLERLQSAAPPYCSAYVSRGDLGRELKSIDTAGTMGFEELMIHAKACGQFIQLRECLMLACVRELWVCHNRLLANPLGSSYMAFARRLTEAAHDVVISFN